MKNRKLWTVALAALLVLTVGATTAFAEEAPATPAAVDEAGPAPLQWMGMGGRFDARFGGRGGMEMWGDRGPLAQGGELLANALGITAEELDQAQQTAYTAALTQAVEDGFITEAQVEKWGDQPQAGLYVLREWYDADAANAFLAEALGISVDELQAARDNIIPAGVEAGLIAEEDAKLMQAGQLIAETMQNAKDEAVAQAVEQGLLTQEQADAMAAHGLRGAGGFDRLPLPGLTQFGGMRGHGDFGGFGGFVRPGGRR